MFAIGGLGGSFPVLTGLAAEWARLLEYYAPPNLIPGTLEDSPQPDYPYYMKEDDGAFLQGDRGGTVWLNSASSRLDEIRSIVDGI